MKHAGADYVWQGGTELTGGGTVSPTATLTVPGAAAGDQLGAATGQGLLLADVAGNGTVDIVTVAAFADVAAPNTGAIYIWSGGSTLTGNPSLLATLSDPAAVASDELGY